MEREDEPVRQLIARNSWPAVLAGMAVELALIFFWPFGLRNDGFDALLATAAWFATGAVVALVVALVTRASTLKVLLLFSALVVAATPLWFTIVVVASCAGIASGGCANH